MSNIVPTQQQADGIQLTKPADWAQFMVTAALKFVSDEKTPIAYASQDEARLDILNTLNWYEAHSEYEWPDFNGLGFDFSQAMRFRRALVNDVFVALQKAGSVRVGVASGAGVLGTPESMKEQRGGVGGRRVAERKRQCRREDDSDTDAASDDSNKSFWHDDEFFAEVMHELIVRSGTDVASYLKGKREVNTFVNTIHDGLVEVWTGPVADHAVALGGLARKQALWAPNEASAVCESSEEHGERHVQRQDECTAVMSVPMSH